MEVLLSEEQLSALKAQVVADVTNGIKTATANNERPYLNQKEIAKWLGVSAPTINAWVKKGMPVAVINGQKLYGKSSAIDWLKQQEKRLVG